MKHSVVALRHGFVSIHPNPEGIVHFIGGYFFGTGVQCWYKGLLDQLKQRFTVHHYSYSFAQLSHWKIAKDLLEEIEHVKHIGIQVGQQNRYQTDVYTDPSKHCLVGHSLGCECISLIRFLGLAKSQQLDILKQAQSQLPSGAVTPLDFSDLEAIPALTSIPYKASLLMAPCYKTPASIGWFLKVRPQQPLVRYLLKTPTINLLPLTSLISFEGDTIAGPDVTWLHPELMQRGQLVNYNQINVQRRGWTALQYHMIPAFDPVASGLSDCASNFISSLVHEHAPEGRLLLS